MWKKGAYRNYQVSKLSRAPFPLLFLATDHISHKLKTFEIITLIHHIKNRRKIMLQFCGKNTVKYT